MSPSLRALALSLLAVLLAACTSLPAGPGADAIASSPWALQSRGPDSAAGQPWSHQAFPGKTPTDFHYVRLDGRDAIAVDARSSASMLRQKLRIAPQDLGLVRFSWKVAALMAEADLATRDKDDAPVRLVLMFDGDRSRFSPRDAALSDLAQALTGEQLPYGTLMYVWSSRRAPGTVIHSARTDRIRKLVLESGAARLNQWLDYERDVRADYRRVFGEPPGALVGIGLMTDSDNTRSRVRAWYGPVRLGPAPAPQETPLSAPCVLC